MAIDKRFTNATSSASGLTGIENFYNSYNKIQNDTVVLQTANGVSIRLVDILKDSAKHKDVRTIKEEDFVDGVLPQNNGIINAENFTYLMSLIKGETTYTMPKLVVNGQTEEIEKNIITTQTVYLRINKTNDTIKLRDVLKSSVKNKPLQEITLDDIEDVYVPEKTTSPLVYDPLVKLIRGETLDANDEVIMTYNGKVINLDHDTYVQEGVATDTTIKVGETVTSSAKREYYTAISTGTDHTPRYVESKEIIPPAYKKTDSSQANNINNPLNIAKILNGQQIALNGAVSYTKDDGTLGYRKNQEVAMINGELFAVPEGYKVDPSHLSATEQAEHISKRVKLGELKTSNVMGSVKGSVSRVFNVGYSKYTVDLGNGVSRTISCYDHHFVIHKGHEEIVFGDEEYFRVSSSVTTRTTFRIKSFQHSYDPATNDFNLDISFVDSFIKNANPATANPTSDELVSSKLVADNQGNITQIKSSLSNGGVEQTFDLNNMFDVNLNVKCSKAFVGNFACYEPAPLYTVKKDANGNVVYKKDSAGNTITDANGQPIPEQEINADFLQTSKVDENGEIKAFDFAENDRLVKEFEQDVLHLQEELVKLKQGDNDQNINAIKDLKTKLDEKLEKIKEIRNKTSIKSVNQIIEDYQNGEFFETFFFDENGEMFEIKDGKKIALSSNTSADYNNLMKDLIGNYTVKNDKGKCQVVLGDTASNIIAGSLKVAEVLYGLSLSTGFLSLLVLPLALTIGTGAIAFAGVVGAVNVVRNKIKQFQLNHLTPEKIKKKLNANCKAKTKQEIKQATKIYNKQVKRIQKNTLDEEKKNELLENAKKQFLTKRAQIIGRLSTLDDMTINSKFSVKDKKITLSNIYGRAEWAKQTKNAKKGAKVDYDTRRATRDAEIKYLQEYTDKLNALPKDKKFKIEKAKLKRQYKIAVDDAVNKYKAQNGPTKGLRSRIHYLKKTLEYRNADDATRQQMIKDCKEAMEKATTIKQVESSVLMSSNSNAERGRLIKFIEEHSPKGVPITSEESAMLLNQEEKRVQQVKDRELATTQTMQAERDYQNVAGFVNNVEATAQTIATKESNNEEINGQEMLDNLKTEISGKAQTIHNQKQQGKNAKQAKMQQQRQELEDRKNKAKAYNESILSTMFASGPVKTIADNNDLELYARTYYRQNNLAIDTPDEEKISTLLNDISTKSATDRDALLTDIAKSNYFRSSYQEIKQEQNEKMIGELLVKDGIFTELNNDGALVVMSKIYIKMKKNQGYSIARPRFTKPKKDAAGNIVKTPHYTPEEIKNIFLKDLNGNKLENAIHIMQLIQQQKEYQDYIAKTSSSPLNP